MTYLDFELDKEETQLLKDYEQGKFRPLPRVKSEQEKYRAYAKAMLDKTRNINIRVSESDLLKIKSKAMQKGIPYQTFLTSLIHQYSTGQIESSILK